MNENTAPAGELTDGRFDHVEMILRDVCEMEPADHEANDTIRIDISDLKRIIERHARPQQIAEPASQWISADDFAALLTFHDQAGDCDADGYTVNKDAMRRLAELGVAQSFGFGRYSVSAFGAWLIETHFDQSPALPLRTYADWNKAQPVANKKEQS